MLCMNVFILDLVFFNGIITFIGFVPGSEGGRLFSRNKVEEFQIGPGGLFFTAEGKGVLKVWKWAAQTL